MFIPNIDCTIGKKGTPDIYGQASAGTQTPERCAVVKMRTESVHTTVRADSGASRAHADEFVSNNRVLLRANTVAQIDDQLTLLGFKIRIKLMHPRLTVIGTLDHYEVEGEVWA